jgi:hypothetical protein
MNRPGAGDGGDPIPQGYRLWVPGDGHDVIPKPRLHPDAYYGPVGDLLHAVEGETEAHPATIGIILITKIGTAIGRRASIQIGEHAHHCNLFNLMVGETSTGRKGVADDLTDKFMRCVDIGFDERHMEGTFGSGQALLDSIANRTDKERESGLLPREKRKCADDPEFATTIRLMHQKESVLGQFIRRGYDYRPITHKTNQHGRQRSTGHHLSFIGAITPDEIEDCVQGVDISNGMLNRFGIYYGEMVRDLPWGGRIHWEGEVADIVVDVQKALDALKPSQPKPDEDLSFEDEEVNGNEDDESADAVEETYSHTKSVREYAIGINGRHDGSEVSRLWGDWYYRVCRGTGPVPELTRRQIVHVSRITNIASVLDMADTVTIGALRFALAWEQYSLDSIECLFGERISGRSADLLQAIRAAGSRGLSGTDQQKLFSNHLDREEVRKLRDDLERRHLIVTVKVPTAGPPRTVSLGIWPQ